MTIKTKEVQKNVFFFWKEVGETTFQAIGRFKIENPQYKDSKMCFAGRLDPLARGWLVLLVGDAVYQKDSFIKKDKVYRASVLLGIETDTDDIFGLIEKNSLGTIDYQKSEQIISRILSEGKGYVKKFDQEFSPFSSKHVNGKALFWWATQKRLDEIEIPKHEVEVYDFNVSQNIAICEKNTWLTEMTKRFLRIEGDFRNEEIIKGWEAALPEYEYENLYHVEVLINASSGMYVRQLVHDIAEKINIPMTVVEITREEVVI